MQSAAEESRAINKELETLQQNVISHHLLENSGTYGNDQIARLRNQ